MASYFLCSMSDVDDDGVEVSKSNDLTASGAACYIYDAAAAASSKGDNW